MDVAFNLVRAINHLMTSCEGCCINVLYSWLGHKVTPCLGVLAALFFFHMKHDVMKLVSGYMYVEYRCLMTDCQLITVSTISSIILDVQALLCSLRGNGTNNWVHSYNSMPFEFKLYEWGKLVKIDLERCTPSSQWRLMQIQVLGQPHFSLEN